MRQMSNSAKAVALKFHHNYLKSDNSISLENSNAILGVSLYSSQTASDLSVKNLLHHYIVPLEKYLSAEDIAVLNDDFSNTVACLLRSAWIFEDSDKRRSISSGVMSLMRSLLGNKSFLKVYLPHAANAFGADLFSPNADILGYESSSRLYAVCRILQKVLGTRMIIEGGRPSLDKEKFEMILSYPPIAGDEAAVADELSSLVTEHLLEDGEMFCLLPSNSSFSGEWLSFRRAILDADRKFSFRVISLPGEEFISCPVCGFSLFCLKNDGKGEIQLVDADRDKFKVLNSYLGSTFNFESVLECMRMGDMDCVWIGAAEDFSGNLIMAPSRFVNRNWSQDLRPGEYCTPAEGLLEPVTLTHAVKSTEAVPMVNVGNLSDSYLKCNIARKDLAKTEKPALQYLTSDAYLAAFVGGEIKIGRIEGVSENAPVALDSRIFAFRIIHDLSAFTDYYSSASIEPLTDKFILRSLTSDFVKRQVEYLSYGTVIKRFDHEDFLRLFFAVPATAKEQEDICAADTQRMLGESQQQIQKAYDDFRKDTHMKKHAMSQTVFDLELCVKILINETRPAESSVSDILDSIKADVDMLKMQLERFDRGYNLSIENIPLTVFIEDYISSHRNPLFEFVYDSSLHHADEDMPDAIIDEEKWTITPTADYILRKGDPLEYVDFPPEALTMIFDDIISNARMHGFSGRPEKGNKIKFEIFSRGTDYVIRISNNGRPLVDGMDAEGVFIYGHTSGKASEHSGIGGYEIRKLMNEFRGEAVMIADSDKEYPVAYELTFHDTDIIASL